MTCGVGPSDLSAGACGARDAGIANGRKANGAGRGSSACIGLARPVLVRPATVMMACGDLSFRTLDTMPMLGISSVRRNEEPRRESHPEKTSAHAHLRDYSHVRDTDVKTTSRPRPSPERVTSLGVNE